MPLAIAPPCEAQVIATKVPPAVAPQGAVGFAVLAATILGSSMVFVDGSVVNVALPALQRDFAASAAQAQWVVESYALFLAALILVGGALGDHFGRKRVFQIGVFFFAITSLLCAIAPRVEILIAARAAQGIAGALLTPASLAIISAAYLDETARGRAIGVWSGATAITSAFGPALGGWLVEHASWRWVFVLNLPLALLVLAIAWRGVPESRDPAAVGLDYPGAALTTLGLGALVFGLIEGPAHGWGDPLILGSIALGMIALILFVWVEAHTTSPMVPLALFRSSTFTGVNILTLLLYGAFGGALFWLPFNLIQVQGYSPTMAGLAFLPTTILIALLSRWTGGLAGRYGARLPLTIGPIIVAAAMFVLGTRQTGSYLETFFPVAILLGLGMAVTVSPLTTAVMSAVTRDHAGIASGINNAVARTASLLAVAIFGVMVAATFNQSLAANLAAIPDLSAETRDAVLAQRADLAASQPPADTSQETATAISAAIDAAFLDGFRQAMIAGAILTLLGAVIAWLMVRDSPPAAS